MEVLRVLPNDPGIRPAGNSDECLYCKRKVGHNHKPLCVILTRTVVYNISYHNEIIGTYTTADPAGWDKDNYYFHKNQGTWCTGNIIDDEERTKIANKEKWEEVLSKSGCMCGIIILLPVKYGTVVRHSNVRLPLNEELLSF